MQALKTNFLLLHLVVILGCLSGCSTIINSRSQKEEMLKGYLNDKPKIVEKELSEKLESTEGSGDEVMWLLEAGSFFFYSGAYEKAIKNLAEAEELIIDYSERAIVNLREAGQESAMLLTNLNAISYSGWYRDRVMLSVLKALSYIGCGKEEAFRAQLNRLRDTQKEIEEEQKEFFDAEREAVAKGEKELKKMQKKAKSEYEQSTQYSYGSNSNTTSSPPPKHNVDELIKSVNEKSNLEKVAKVANRGYGDFLNPIAIFMSGLGFLRDGNFENAHLEFKRLYEAMPQNELAQRYYVTVLKESGRRVPFWLWYVKPFNFNLGSDCVYVIFANGQGAALKQHSIYFPVMVAWPVCEFFHKSYNSLMVSADGKSYKSTLVADMDGIFTQEYKERLPGVITRTILSTLVKEVSSYIATYIARRQGGGAAGSITYLCSAVYRFTFNTADTRSWMLLPREYQLVQLPMPKDHKLSITLKRKKRKKASSRHKIELILPAKSRSAIVYVNAPNFRNVKTNVLNFATH